MKYTQKKMTKAKTSYDLVLAVQERISSAILFVEVFNMQNLLELSHPKLTDFQQRIMFP